MNTIHDPQSTVQAAPAIAAVSRAADTSAADASVLTAKQAAGVDRAKAYHSAIRRTAEGVGIYTYLLGHQCIQLKDSLKHGEWGSFVATHLTALSPRTIQFAMSAVDQIRKSADLPVIGKVKLLSDGSVDKASEQEISAAWSEFAEGKTITEIMRGIGAIREKRLQEHHNPKPRTVDERLEGRRKAALQIHLDLRADVNLLIGRITRSDDQGDMITLMDTTEWWKTLRTLRRLTKLIVPLTKRKLTEAQKKQEMKRLQKEEAERQKATADKR